MKNIDSNALFFHEMIGSKVKPIIFFNELPSVSPINFDNIFIVEYVEIIVLKK